MIEKTCTLLFLTRDDKVLLAMKKRGFGSNRYNGVGGKIEPGESIEQALRRECQEEIGVIPTNYWKVAEHDFVQQEGGTLRHTHVYTFLCDEWEGEPCETEEMAPEWFHVTNIPYDRMWQGDKFWLPQVLAGKTMRGTYTFDQNDTLLTQDVTISGGAQA